MKRKISPFHSQYISIHPSAPDGLPPLLQTLAKGFLLTTKDPYHTLSQKGVYHSRARMTPQHMSLKTHQNWNASDGIDPSKKYMKGWCNHHRHRHPHNHPKWSQVQSQSKAYKSLSIQRCNHGTQYTIYHIYYMYTIHVGFILIIANHGQNPFMLRSSDPEARAKYSRSSLLVSSTPQWKPAGLFSYLGPTNTPWITII